MKLLKSFVTKLSDIIEFIQYWTSLGIIAFLTALIFIQVILRYVFNVPIIWSHEIASGLLIWLTFMGAGVLTRKQQHLKVDIVFNMFSSNFKKLLNKIFQALILIFSLFLIVYSYKLFNQQLHQIVGSLKLSKAYYFSLPVFIFGITILIYSLELLITEETKEF